MAPAPVVVGRGADHRRLPRPRWPPRRARADHRRRRADPGLGAEPRRCGRASPAGTNWSRPRPPVGGHRRPHRPPVFLCGRRLRGLVLALDRRGRAPRFAAAVLGLAIATGLIGAVLMGVDDPALAPRRPRWVRRPRAVVGFGPSAGQRRAAGRRVEPLRPVDRDVGGARRGRALRPCRSAPRRWRSQPGSSGASGSRPRRPTGRPAPVPEPAGGLPPVRGGGHRSDHDHVHRRGPARGRYRSAWPPWTPTTGLVWQVLDEETPIALVGRFRVRSSGWGWSCRRRVRGRAAEDHRHHRRVQRRMDPRRCGEVRAAFTGSEGGPDRAGDWPTSSATTVATDTAASRVPRQGDR